MIKLLTNFFLLFIVISCQSYDSNLQKNVNKKINNDKVDKVDKVSKSQNILKKSEVKVSSDFPVIKFILEDPYYIDGVLHIPEEDYQYSEVGLASFYGRELHNIKTINNDFNKVTELLGRHKTLPLPSMVKITNLENGMFLTLKIIDRHNDNATLIQVSRKTSQLLKFYKNKITKVRVEVIPDASKQLKIVAQSMSDPIFFDTIDKAPTVKITILELENDDKGKEETKNLKNIELIQQPIEIGSAEVLNKELFLKIYGFRSLDKAKSAILDLNKSYKNNIIKINNSYILTLGPLSNLDAKNLVLSFISKGYKKTKFILE